MNREVVRKALRGAAMLVIALGTAVLMSEPVKAEDPPGCNGGCITPCLASCDNNETWCYYNCSSQTGEAYAQCIDGCWDNYLACRNECISNCDWCAG
ncbi:MAG TPA: hypothetical protein VNT81_01985 [Vicinamibacterales bacterium]|nr:hypothetical protein [Vicinamibacterales bacterium]